MSGYVQIEPGTRLGPYEVIVPLGAGGMGEVYRARDTRLDRTVAVKVLAGGVANNRDFQERFEREARSISSLNHPNICALYDVGQHDGTPYLVMEHLDGESLADRLSRGPLPFEQVLRYGTEIARALDAAHQQGIVHRDLKPGNVMITRAGAKLLDFGLAKAARTPSLTDSAGFAPTEQKPLTTEGTVLGTFQYMAPEQVAGLAADARTDIFALGAVLYEMATGKRAFAGKNKTSLIAAIVGGAPPPIRTLQPITPPAFEHAVERCLAKEPDERWQSARDVAAELDWIGEAGSGAGVAAPVAARRKSRERLAWTLALLASLAAIGFAGPWFVERVRPRAAIYSSIVPPDGHSFAFELSSAVVSPDGSRVAFVARGGGRMAHLWVREMSSPKPRMLDGTDGASFPFWSPDGRHLGYFAGGKLFRVDVAGAAPEPIADAPAGRGGSWSQDGVIAFAPSLTDGISRVAATGGSVTQLTRLVGGASHRYPFFLPDGRRFLYYVQGTKGVTIHVGSIDGKVDRPLLVADSNAAYAMDHILFVRGRLLRAQRIDPEGLELLDEPITIADGVQYSSSLNWANFSVSTTGVLTYVSGSAATASRLRWLDRSGKEVGVVGVAGEYFDPRLSPDEKTLAVTVADGGAGSDLWLHDLPRGVVSRFTFDAANDWGAVWSADNRELFYSSFETSAAADLLAKPVTRVGSPRRLVSNQFRKIASSALPDGTLFYHQQQPRFGWDVFVYSRASGKSTELISTPFAEFAAQVSPDGRWLAYVSTETGSEQIYMQRYPPTGEKWQVTTDGGVMPVWSRNGRELFYYAPVDQQIAAVPVAGSERLELGAAQKLFTVRLRYSAILTRNQYDVSRDGRFIVNAMAEEERAAPPVTLMQNWMAKLR